MRRYGPGGNFWDQHRALPYRPIETWQIWNEPNLSSFYGPSVDPSGYALLVAAGAAGIRSEDPDAQVLLAGLTGNRTNGRRMSTRAFLKGLYTVPGIATSFDGIAIHPYNRRARGTIDQIKAARKIASANLDNAGIWVTEVGWASAGKRKKWGLVKSPDGQARVLRPRLHEDHAGRRAVGRAGRLLVRVAGHREGAGRVRLVSVVGPAEPGRRAQAGLLGAARDRRRLARQLVAQLGHAVGERAGAGELHRPAGGRSIEERLARTEDHGDDGEMHLVEQPGVGELRGDVAAADDPEVAFASRGDHLVVEVGDRSVGDPHVDAVALGDAEVARAQRPVGLVLIRPRGVVVEVVEHELVGGRAADQGADVRVEALVGAAVAIGPGSASSPS